MESGDGEQDQAEGSNVSTIEKAVSALRALRLDDLREARADVLRVLRDECLNWHELAATEIQRRGQGR